MIYLLQSRKSINILEMFEIILENSNIGMLELSNCTVI